MRDQILEAAVKRIAQEGTDGVRVARVANEASVSTALVHYHFETRDLLLAEALAYSYDHAAQMRVGEELGEDATSVQRLAEMIDICLPTSDALHDDFVLWVELWLRAAREPDLRDFAARLYAKLYDWFELELRAGIESGEFVGGDVELITNRLLALIDGFGIRTLIGDPAITLEYAREQIWAAIAPELGLGVALAPPSGNS
ncbi:MAG: TetR family transcriptional regulator [Solirubrobacteraceae bacterium]|jgi:AcrR family transcriptional regulator|nr:TetR family transcriptional regulator [Solirubrobacteraceae bacterium]MDP4672990.1 TetR family transcriptional regulator [Solirubrobacteraceae bacterium]